MGAYHAKGPVNGDDAKRQSIIMTLGHVVASATRLSTNSMVTVKSDIPSPFSRFQLFSEEWNLCGKYDPMRSVNVVSDPKMQRKRVPGFLFVEKRVSLRDPRSIALLRNELEMLLYLLRFAQANLGSLPPNVVQVKGYYAFRGAVHIFVEYCDLGNLQRAYLDDPSPLLRIFAMPVERELRAAMFQITTGVAALHDNGVAHCDLALENVFVTKANEFKIGDLEHAVFVGPENTPHAYPGGAHPLRRMYGAPELYSSHDGVESLLDLQKVDAWALGVILVMLFTRKPLFDTTAPTDEGFQLFSRVGLRHYLRAMYLEQSAVCKFSEPVLMLLSALLCINPAKRMTVTAALETTWLQADKS